MRIVFPIYAEAFLILVTSVQSELDNSLWVWVVAEHAYRLTQQLDPRSEGRGVLQFKTGLKSIIKVVTQYSPKPPKAFSTAEMNYEDVRSWETI